MTLITYCWLRRGKLLAAMVSFAALACHAQVVEPIPGFLQDYSGQLRLPVGFSFEQQIQAGTQANSATSNPFAYWHGLQIRPWFHYDGFRNVTLTASMSYIAYFGVPKTSNYRHHEWRVTAMGVAKQPISGGSLYEEIRFEWLDFRSGLGTVEHLPRLRFRFGQNLYLAEGDAKPFLGVYEEAILQFPQPSYSQVKFQGARFFAGAGFRAGARTTILLGFKAEGEVSSSGSSVAVYYGPAFSIEYNFRRDHPISENHRRTTAFKDF
ncbi:MAG: DUF2490 domain-containing protein [Bryobacteraceae bacterium]